nr:nuclease [Rhizobium sp. Q54]
MLSEIEITYFRSRIGDVLRDGHPTPWQRQFLSDMQSKLHRYGTKTQLSQKQLGMLRRLTKIEGPADYSAISTDRYRGPRGRKSNEWQHRVTRRWRYREFKWLAFLLVIVVMSIGQMFKSGASWLGTPNAPTASSQTSFSTQQFTVTDGDTIRMADGTPVRLLGFNTPEKFEPMCAREAELGNRATERLRQLVSSGTSTVTQVACACAPGTQGTKRCNFGRSCGILRVDGKDVSQTLIAEGLAVSFHCGRTQCPRLPRPWCG